MFDLLLVASGFAVVLGGACYVGRAIALHAHRLEAERLDAQVAVLVYRNAVDAQQAVDWDAEARMLGR